MIDTYFNTVIEGDCLDILPKIPSKSINMILCDLPYGITQNPWDKAIEFETLWEQYERVIKDNAAIVLFSQGVFTGKLISSNIKLFKYKMVWIKSKPTNFLNVTRQPLRRHEDICVFYRNQPTYHPQRTKGKPYDKGSNKARLTGSYGDFVAKRKFNTSGIRQPHDVLMMDEDDFLYFKSAESEDKLFHPNQKPVNLARYLIRTYSDINSVILDNACGSGSFLVAAVLEGRNFIGIELNRQSYRLKNEKVDFIHIARTRIEKAYKQRKDDLNKLSLF